MILLRVTYARKNKRISIKNNFFYIFLGIFNLNLLIIWTVIIIFEVLPLNRNTIPFLIINLLVATFVFVDIYLYKKNNNIFRATQMNNAMRILAVFCLVVVIGAMLLLITLPSNRQKIMGWFRGDSFGVTVKNSKVEKQNEAGINGAAVVNENMKVSPISVDDHLSGNISAPVKIIIYLDFQCPFCGQLYNSVV